MPQVHEVRKAVQGIPDGVHSPRKQYWVCPSPLACHTDIRSYSGMCAASLPARTGNQPQSLSGSVTMPCNLAALDADLPFSLP